VHDLEFADIESRVVEGLKAGNESLKMMHRLLSVEDVEKIMDETREAVEYQNEIDSIMTGGLSDTDMADVEDELAEILGQTEEPSVRLPDVPAEPLPEPEPAKASLAKLKRKKEAEEMIAA
uniref:Charged multivesicular body protein 6 n=1 Tax=Plectus sambesii TaxID=2011161 RepID=A0A914VHL0_9BILA